MPTPGLDKIKKALGMDLYALAASSFEPTRGVPLQACDGSELMKI
jgi:hypothetical protein